MTPKRYDRAYFDRWYRGPEPAVGSHADLERNVAVAVAAAESVLARPLKSVLDVGCGEGRWRAPLLRARPGASYLGVDGSAWVVRRHGQRRNIRLGTFATLGRLGLRRRFDLIVCSDVLHYLPTVEVRQGLSALRRLAGGVLWLDALTSDDAFDGDREGWQARGARTYRRLFAEAGLRPCGLNCWAPRTWARTLIALERGPRS
jgi:SAM-dependent methyltransferase